MEDARRKKILIISALVLAIVIAAGIIMAIIQRGDEPKNVVKDQTQTAEFFRSRILARNIQFPVAQDTTHIRFFTGTAFAVYDLNSQTSAGLTREIRLPVVLKVVWGTNHALIKATNLTADDMLFDQLPDKSLVNKPTWWIVDFASSSVRPLQGGEIKHADITDVFIVPDNANNSPSLYIAHHNGQNGNSTNLSASASLSPIAPQAVFTNLPKDVQIVGSVGNDIVLQEPGKIHVVSGGKTRNYSANHTGELVFSRQARTVYFTTSLEADLTTAEADHGHNDRAPQRFASLNIDNGEQGIIMDTDKYLGKMAVTPAGNGMILANDKDGLKYQGYEFNQQTGSRTTLQTASVSNDKTGLLTNLLPLPGGSGGTQTFAATTSENYLLYFSKDKAAVEKLKAVETVPFKPKDRAFSYNNLEAAYDLSADVFQIWTEFAPELTFEQAVDLTYAQLRNRNIDPHQLRKQWLVIPRGD